MNCVFPYKNIKVVEKNKMNHQFWNQIFSKDFFKVGLLCSTLSLSFLMYIITINISSTQGYYYDQVRKQQERVNFNYNIVQLSTLTLQSDLRSSINFNPSLQKDSIQYLEKGK
jgi:hypothetical protein